MAKTSTTTNPPEDYDISYKLALTRRFEQFKEQPLSQKLFLLVFALIIPGIYPWLTNFHELYVWRKNGNPDYDWPVFWELKTAVSTVIVCYFLRSYIMKAFVPVFDAVLRPDFTGVERKERAKRAAQCAFKALYFISIVIIGYVAMKDAIFFPSVLGGSGDASLMWAGYPYMNQESYQMIRGYLMISLGYHIFSLITHCTGRRRNDFMELLLHHVMTVALIFNGYFLNIMPAGSMISLIHDVSDVFIYLSRVFVDTIYDKLAFFFYLGIMTVFAYMRLYVYPFYMLYHSMWYNEAHKNDIPGFKLMFVFLHALLCLHIYWYFLMAKIGLKYVTKGKAEDRMQMKKSEFVEAKKEE